MALAILAAMAIDDLRRDTIRLGWPLAWTLVALTIAVSIAWPWRTSWEWPTAQIKQMGVLMGVAILWALLGLGLFLLTWFCLRNEQRRYALSALLMFDAAVLFAVPELSGVHPGQVDKPAIDYLRSHLGLSRFYTVGPIEPNYGAYFQIASINHNYLPISLSWINYVKKELFPYINRTNGVTFFPYFGAQFGIADLIQHIENYENVGVRYVLTNSGQSLVPLIRIPAGTNGNTPLPLLPGQSALVTFTLPPEWKNKKAITGVGVLQGNYGNTANGNLAIKICAPTHDCVAGSRPLSESRDDSVFSIPLSQPLRVETAETLTITIKHVGGSRPEALWLWPQHPGYMQIITGPQGPMFGKALQLSLEYSDADTVGIRKVYSDSVMDIWELPHPASYYTVVNGQCALTRELRNSVRAHCATPATLLRRELFMPGWTATVNGAPVMVAKNHEIFQTVQLPKGNSNIRFHFAPPYVGYAWIAFWLGLAGLGWTAFSWWRRPKGKKESMDWPKT
jgi:hypothetical protein